MEANCIDTQVVTSGRRNPLHFGLPKRLRAAREAADLGVAQLSLAAGLSDPVATTIERGQVPYLDTVEKLARVLKLSPCVLAYGVQASFVDGPDLLCAAVGERLRHAREVKGVSRRGLGKIAGLSTTAISKIEGGTIPSVATAEALAKALGIDPCWLGYGQGTAPDLPAQGTA